MGASVVAYWPGITEEQLESQPGFYNDSKAWGDWMAERENEQLALEAIRKLKAEAILTFTTDGVEEENVQWVTPQELSGAAQKLRVAVSAGLPETEIILGTYERVANGIESVKDEFLRDLEDVEAISNWAGSEGAVKMTLEVNW